MKVEVKEIRYASWEYSREIELRTKILREPLGLRYSEKDLADEINEIHLCAFHESQIVGCLLLKAVGKSIMKMRQVAVDTNAQGLGIGRLLVEASEEKSKAMGASEIQLHARDTAVPFYLKLGYEIFDEPFVEVGIPHRKMKKSIRSQNGKM